VKIYGTVLRVEKLRNSKDGNPSFCFVTDCANLGEMHIKSAKDLMQSYSVTESNMVGKSYVFYCSDIGVAYSWEELSV
jgi:hypothetical protein